MPFEISGLTTMSTDFKQSVCGEGGIRTFSLYKKVAEGESPAGKVPADERNKYELQES